MTQKNAVLISVIPEHIFGAMMLTGKQTCPGAISSTINFTWNHPESNLGLCGEKPDTTLLIRGTDAVFITCPNARYVAVSWWIIT
jgi:hypothetical protein